jgi:hypothetical protein
VTTLKVAATKAAQNRLENPLQKWPQIALQTVG